MQSLGLDCQFRFALRGSDKVCREILRIATRCSFRQFDLAVRERERPFATNRRVFRSILQD